MTRYVQRAYRILAAGRKTSSRIPEATRTVCWKSLEPHGQRDGGRGAEDRPGGPDLSPGGRGHPGDRRHTGRTGTRGSTWRSWIPDQEGTKFDPYENDPNAQARGRYRRRPPRKRPRSGPGGRQRGGRRRGYGEKGGRSRTHGAHGTTPASRSSTPGSRERSPERRGRARRRLESRLIGKPARGERTRTRREWRTPWQQTNTRRLRICLGAAAQAHREEGHEDRARAADRKAEEHEGKSAAHTAEADRLQDQKLQDWTKRAEKMSAGPRKPRLRVAPGASGAGRRAETRYVADLRGIMRGICWGGVHADPGASHAGPDRHDGIR